MYHYFKSKPGSKFEKEVKQYFEKLPLWNEVLNRINLLLGENLQVVARNPRVLVISPSELELGENKKLFKKSGELKRNSKRAKMIAKAYQDIIKELDLNDFEELGVIFFYYGITRSRGQSLQFYVTPNNQVYFRSDYNLQEKAPESLIRIMSDEYYEVHYLNMVKSKKIKEG